MRRIAFLGNKLTPDSKNWATVYRRMYVTVTLLTFIVVILVILVVALQIQVQGRTRTIKSVQASNRALEVAVNRNSNASEQLNDYIRGLVAQAQQGESSQEILHRIEQKVDALGNK